MIDDKTYDKLCKLESNPAYQRVSAYIILDSKKEYCGNLRVYRPKDGAGRLTVVLNEFGKGNIFIGSAGGYGYDKLQAALNGAAFGDAVLSNHSTHWQKLLHDAGYTVIQAI